MNRLDELPWDVLWLIRAHKGCMTIQRAWRRHQTLQVLEHALMLYRLLKAMRREQDLVEASRLDSDIIM
jgi:hypothetical protein